MSQALSFEEAFAEVGEVSEEDILKIQAKIATREWTVPEGEELDVEATLVPESVLNEMPTQQQLAAVRPSNLLPPRIGSTTSTERSKAIEAYGWAQARARWPKLPMQYEVHQEELLGNVEQQLRTAGGDIEVMEILGDPHEALKDPMLLTTWLACLRKFEDYATVLKDAAPDRGIRLIIKR